MEVRPIEELQDPSSSPRREEVGRRTLGAIGGSLLSFFYRERFQLFTQQIPLFVEKLQNRLKIAGGSARLSLGRSLVSGRGSGWQRVPVGTPINMSLGRDARPLSSSTECCLRTVIRDLNRFLR